MTAYQPRSCGPPSTVRTAAPSAPPAHRATARLTRRRSRYPWHRTRTGDRPAQADSCGFSASSTSSGPSGSGGCSGSTPAKAGPRRTRVPARPGPLPGPTGAGRGARRGGGTARPGTSPGGASPGGAPVAGDEHVLVALVGAGLTGEAAVQRRNLQAGHVQQPQPLVLRRPPQGACPAAVEGEVDPVVAHPVPDRVRDRLVLVAAVEADGGMVAEDEGVPREAPVRAERGRDALEGAAA